jgi:hypothetical protein
MTALWTENHPWQALDVGRRSQLETALAAMLTISATRAVL